MSSIGSVMQCWNKSRVQRIKQVSFMRLEAGEINQSRVE